MKELAGVRRGSSFEITAKEYQKHVFAICAYWTADSSKGGLGTRPPPVQFLLIFKQFSAKSLPNDRLVPLPGVGAPFKKSWICHCYSVLYLTEMHSFLSTKIKGKNKNKIVRQCSKYFTASVLICTWYIYKMVGAKSSIITYTVAFLSL